MMWFWSGAGIHWWAWFIGFLLTVGFWALVIFLVLSLVRAISVRDGEHVHVAGTRTPRGRLRGVS